jgi:hypothetical protein
MKWMNECQGLDEDRDKHAFTVGIFELITAAVARKQTSSVIIHCVASENMGMGNDLQRGVALNSVLLMKGLTKVWHPRGDIL